MAAAYSNDLRAKVLAACDKDLTVAELAELFSVSQRWVYKLKKCLRETGHSVPIRQKPGRKSKLAAQLPRLQALVQEQPDSTLEELRAKLNAGLCTSSVWNALKALGLSLKKSSLRR
jgi:transposase